MAVGIPSAWADRPEWLRLHCRDGAAICRECFLAAEKRHEAAGTRTFRYDAFRDDPYRIMFLFGAMPKDSQARRLMQLYRLTPEEHFKILRYQGNVCAISKKPSTNYGTDHDHKTGLIRGRIDWRLNRGLAYFNDDPALLRAAADYLENPPATAALGAPRYGVIGKAKHKKKMVYGPPARIPHLC